MYKGKVNGPVAVAANTDVPFTTVFNTNGKTSPSGGKVNILSPGYWNVKAQINFTAADGAIGWKFYSNGQAIDEDIWNITAITANTYTATLINAFKVLRSANGFADFSIRPSIAATVNTAVFIVDEER